VCIHCTTSILFSDKALMAFWFLLMIMRFVTKYRRYKKANRVNNEINPEMVSLLR